VYVLSFSITILIYDLLFENVPFYFMYLNTLFILNIKFWSSHRSIVGLKLITKSVITFVYYLLLIIYIHIIFRFLYALFSNHRYFHTDLSTFV